MKSLVCMIILMWNTILHAIGRSFGLFLGGLVVGFKTGIQDQYEMGKYMRYRSHQMSKRIKEMQDGNESDND